MGIHTTTKEKWYQEYLYHHNRLNPERIPLKKTVFFKLVELEDEIKVLVNQIASKAQPIHQGREQNFKRKMEHIQDGRNIQMSASYRQLLKQQMWKEAEDHLTQAYNHLQDVIDLLQDTIGDDGQFDNSFDDGELSGILRVCMRLIGQELPD